MRCVHVVECYSAVERDEILVRVVTLMNPENRMLSERSQTYEATHCTIDLKYQNK